MKTLGESVSNFCSDCGGEDLVYDQDSGEVICRKCGLVVEESNIDTGPEWRAFTLKDRANRPRVGLPPSFSIHDKGLSTMIGPLGRDAHGRRIPSDTRFQMFRLKKWNVRLRIQESFDRNMSQAMIELSRLADRLHISRAVKEEAALIYRKALRKGAIRGRSISSMVAASIYVACRITQTPRTLDEVARHTTLEKKDIARCYRFLLRELNLRAPVPKAQIRVPKIASEVKLGEETQRMAIEILSEADRLKITTGKSPMGLAAAALYLACVMNGENRTQKMLAKASGVTEVTIRNRYKELKSALETDFFGSYPLTK